ncbi:hypothetical protein LHK_01683 [Laribacter hongkongensis HLHK9]|uniref:Uncharacterized protein n=1 Tax=Laribacter hongkongensis (strain HLHK9) TaxID=557598 RepID=C1D878_LARHH|nr:hypothetical protein [Laribacter hongkongensis]ACO74668.1 hypothetical protein LHK_01683 [Laribacter hongkongensis HLHK9]
MPGKCKPRRQYARKPTLVGVHQAFAEVDELIGMLETEGATLADQDGQPVFRAGDGRWYYTGEAFDGWIDFWRVAQRRFLRPLPIAPLEALVARVRDGGSITEDEVTAARSAVEQLRSIYRSMTVDLIIDLRDTTLIGIELEKQKEAA